jgi:hypothetical protein
MENQQQQINPTHINALIDSMTKQNSNLTLQLADAQGLIAVLQEELQKLQPEPQDAQLAE